MYQSIVNYEAINENMIPSYLKKCKDDEMPIYIIDNSGEYIYVNNTFLRLLNIRDEENVKKDITSILGSKNIKYLTSIKQSVIHEKTKKTFNEYIYINGREMIWRVTSIPIVDEEGHCNQCLSMAKVSYKKDIDLEKSDVYGNLYNIQYSIIGDDNEREEEFIYEEVYNYIQEISNYVPLEGMSIWDYNDKLKIIKKRISSGIVRHTFDGVEMPFNEYSEQYIMRNSKNLFYPIPIKSYEKYFIDSGFKDSYDMYLYNKYIMYLPIVYDGKFLGILNLYFSTGELSDSEYMLIKRVTKRISLCLKNIELLHNVTNQLHEKIKLQNSLSRYLNSSVDLCIILDMDFNIITVSYSVIKLLGWSFEEMKMQGVKKILNEDYENRIKEDSIKNKYNTRVYLGPYKVKCKDGTVRDVELYHYIDSINNEIVLTGQDLTDLNKLKAKTEFLQNEVKKEKVKNEFITNISHEFRTPLNLILSAVQLEEFKNKNNVTEKGKLDNITLIKQSSYRLLRLSNNIIDITAIDSQCMQLNYHNLNLLAYIRELSVHVEDYCKKINRNFFCELNNLNVTLACDKDKMEKVILNLLSNAIKFTDEGGNIVLGANVDRKANRLYMWVQDDGYGIPEEDYDSVFSSFTQVDDILIRRAEGSGLGLAICKAFVEMHGGKIYIQPLKKCGTKMVLYIPITLLQNDKISANSLIFSSPKTNVQVEFSDIYM